MKTLKKEKKEKSINEKVFNILSDALGANEKYMRIDDSLKYDLNAESIDYLDITFRLEREFEIRIAQSDLFPSTWPGISETLYFTRDRFTEEGIAALRRRYFQVDFEGFENNPKLEELSRRETVESLVDYIEAKLRPKNAS